MWHVNTAVRCCTGDSKLLIGDFFPPQRLYSSQFYTVSSLYMTTQETNILRVTY